MLGSLFRVAGTAGLVVGGGLIGRSWLDGVVGDKVKKDRSDIAIDIRRRLPKKIKIEYINKGGEVTVGVLDSHLYSEEVTKYIIMLEMQREKLKKISAEALEDEMREPFVGAIDRIGRFADWYFSYTTGYAILSKLLTSTASNALSLTRARTISEEVQHDIEKYIETYYKNIVLRPEQLDPLLSRAFTNSLKISHDSYMETISICDEGIKSTIQSRSPHVTDQQTMLVTLDWSAQTSKAHHLKSSFEKSPEASIGLVAAGSLLGKTMGSAAVSKGACGGLASKLASPFVTAAGTGGLSGLLLGPGGAIIGAGVGVGVDMIINKGTELMSRSSFESDVREAVDSARNEWTDRAQQELNRAIDVWVDDSIQSMQYPLGAKGA